VALVEVSTARVLSATKSAANSQTHVTTLPAHSHPHSTCASAVHCLTRLGLLKLNWSSHYSVKTSLHSTFSPEDSVPTHCSVTTITETNYQSPMAEAFTVIGIVANILQLVDFSSRVLGRLNEFHSSLGEVPSSFRHFPVELPVLQNTLLQTREAIDGGLVKGRLPRLLSRLSRAVQSRLDCLKLY
jgi:hypothetical protein